MSAAQLAQALHARPGPLGAALHLLDSLGWLRRVAGTDAYAPTVQARLRHEMPADLPALLSFDVNAYLSGQCEPPHGGARWLQLSARGWNVSHPALADDLDACLLLPLLSALAPAGQLETPLLQGVPEPVASELRAWLASRQWCEGEKGVCRPTASGRRLFDQLGSAFTALSYRPLMSRLQAAIFAQPPAAGPQPDSPGEAIDDASGWAGYIENAAERARYLEQLREIVVGLFDRLPVEAQPVGIVHLGCRDGVLLEMLADLVVHECGRGRLLARHPLRLIGIGPDAAPGHSTRAGVASRNAEFIRDAADDPTHVFGLLKHHGVTDTQAMLYVRAREPLLPSFCTPRVLGGAAALAEALGGQGGLPTLDGGQRHDADRAGRWAAGIGAAAWVELNEYAWQVDPAGGADDGEVATSEAGAPPPHAQAHALAHAPAPVRDLMTLAGAGMFPGAQAFHKYPRRRPVTLATLGFYERRAYTVRFARVDDLPALSALEAQCWAPGIRADDAALLQRVTRDPHGQLVLAVDGIVKGCIYSQRLRAAELLDGETFETASRLHSPDGPIVQLLALNIAPDVQDQQFGDQLLEFMLQRCSLLEGVHSVVGVTRCRDRARHAHLPLADYIAMRNERGELVDPVLRLHERHGAAIRKLMAGYRPMDDVNDGHGVLVHYDLARRTPAAALGAGERAPVSAGAAPPLALDAETWVCTRLRSRLQLDDNAELDRDRPLMEMGLDSADLLDLAADIGSAFKLSLTALFFFENNTCRKIIAALQVRCQPLQAETHAASPSAAPGAPAPHEARLASPQPPASSSSPQPRAGDIAIVGAACRLPGDVDSLEQFWRLLVQGEEVVGQLPADRWQWPADIDLEGQHRGIDRGAFLSDVGRFDAAFFRISAHEAALMDPQQRILLELAWQCLEDAGHAPAALAGSDTAVYVGASGSDYRLLVDRVGAAVEGHSGLGTSMSILANRISYFFDFRGPSLQIDTACSSSLVAVHEAVQSLRAGRCSQALVAGIHLMCDLSTTLAYYRAGMLSRDGRCRSFDASANGYVRAEGAVVLLLKPHEQALRDRDHVYAVLKGSAVNHGGQTGGLTVPSPGAQARLVLEACRDAGVPVRSLGYVEAHGTGTPLGDPIEVAGLAGAFEQDGPAPGLANARCGLGSLKTNVGHLEAAAGIAGLLKLMLCLQHRWLPASLHFERLNPQITLAGTPFHVVDAAGPWAAAGAQPLRAGVSSFGSGGTNAHVVLEEHRAAPAAEAQRPQPSPSRPALIVLSARSAERLRTLAASLRTHWRGQPPAQGALADIAYTLQVGRAQLEHRLAFTAASPVELQAKLDAYLDAGSPHEAGGLAVGEVKKGSDKGSDPLSALGEDDDVLQLLNAWIEKGKCQKLLALWAAGLDLDWPRLYRDGGAYAALTPARVSLPTYPFERTRHWVASPAAPARPAASVPGAAAGPASTGVAASRQAQDMMEAPAFFVPAWEACAAATGDAPPAHERVVVITASAQQQPMALAIRHPLMHVVGCDEHDSVDQLAQRLHLWDDIRHVVWVAPPHTGTSLLDDEVVAQQQRGVVHCFRLVKALLQLGYARKPLGWTFVTRQSQAVLPHEPIDPTHATVHGWAGAMAKEQPQWQVRSVDLPLQHDEPLAEMLRLPAAEGGSAYAYRDGEWYRQALVPCEVPVSAAPPAYRRQGVYVVIGGAGGLGEVFSRFLIERHQAQLIWIGRRPPDAQLQHKIDQLGALGPAPVYLQADATDRAALGAAYRHIKAQFGAIHGLVHAAITLRDKSVAQMEEAQLREGLSAKVDVCVRLAQVFAPEPLDFVLFFSSMQGLFKPAGQSNYAAGCTFKDAYAHALGQVWSCPVKVMNWGYWGSVGIVASDAYRARMARQGIGSIEPDAGMQALDTLLRGPLDRLAFLRIDRHSPLASMVDADRWVRLPARAAQTGTAAAPAGPATVMALPPGLAAAADEIAGSPAVSAPLLARWLFVQLRKAGLPVREDGQVDQAQVAAWQHAVDLPPLYGRWLQHGLRIARAQLAEGQAAGPAVGPLDEAALRRLWAAHKAELSAHRGMQAQAELAEAALQALPDILAGRRAATDVLFPRGSLELVGAVYQGNPASDFYNDVLAGLLAGQVQERVRHDPAARVRILEIGAGTGATTARVLRQLEPLRDHIGEYCYTDISKVFLMDARQRYAAGPGYLTFKLFNVEQPLREQEIEVGAYDIVVACNVLHATRNIRRTLRNAKACLRRQGLLLLNELSSISLLHHLTFGLLDGWWRYEDERVRIAGSPALPPAMWRRVLEAEGFLHIGFPASGAHEHGQQIVVATSDGWVRQPAALRVDPVAPLAGTQPQAAPAAATAGPAARLAAASSGGSVSALAPQGVRERVMQRISPVIGIPADEIDADVDFNEYGVDSILAMKLLHELEQEFGVSLPNSTLIDHRTIAQLSAALLKAAAETRAAGAPGAGEVRPPGGATAAGAALGGMTEADARADAARPASPVPPPSRRITEVLEQFRDGDIELDQLDTMLAGWTE
ncbi:SDR family NAD(P)-dependent oxidoreductase (plasmid) [Eleftheria terrae]|nr:SDR family NAD(P)-dependent oxidoreductase [Eleftheria terrae]WKB56131.1 SDR family NAD(P)-dependent oxidoreductase [Eleftheria terrae]